METPKIYESQYQFCLILWEHEPIRAAELVKLCATQLGWKRTTTYTVIKKLEERGILRNDDGVISALVTKEQVQIAELDELMEKTFEGSIPSFLAAFAKRQKLTDADLDEMQKMIDTLRAGVGQ